LTKIFLRYILKKEEKPMLYLQTSSTTALDLVKYNNPWPNDPYPECDCDECCDDSDDDEEDNEMNDLNDQRGHLSSRVYQIANQHESDLRAAFHLNNDEAPESFDELVARFASGKVQFSKDIKSDRKFSYAPDLMRYIVWRDPAVPADKAGYDAAEAEMMAARTNVLDDVAILEPKEALASVRAFEKATFH
jgi:hypothetical protein